MTWAVWQGHVLDGLASMPDESVHCIVTSPPLVGIELSPEYAELAWLRMEAPARNRKRSVRARTPAGKENAAWARKH